MEINVVKDEKGKVVATFENAVAGGPSVKPLLKAGHTIQEVEAADNYKANLKALYAQYSR